MAFAQNEFRYCPLCSALLEYNIIEDKRRLKCPVCGYTHWGEFSLGVGGVIVKNNKGLLVQRAYHPGKGRWTIPGGFVEQDEKIEHAVVREIREETGLITQPVTIIAIKDRPEDLPGVKHDIYIVFLMELLGGELKPDPAEVSAVGFFAPEQCSDFNAAPLSVDMIEKAIKYTKPGPANPGFIRKDTISMVGSLTTLFTLPE
ncbi:NUDIX hydrolase [Syntrophobotulus glycolicus DSM 8271]|uniref:NUDIX hydrolase n=1 Tax=Syntrophobotulus glycolicus (strain DSM 8271 / FlGlyR) TaxID=645991 RepID=F0SWW8_SYNGF|nr:NUDIX domain-containing protein [Syntrophobotulus glycolicus]ADY54658.1 NUDIX hydrolase [Syntrophobotulus glycolicus DSM 8271]